TRRYFPANGTAGLARSLVNGNSRLPCPPPMITESTSLVLSDWRRVYDITNPLVQFLALRPFIALSAAKAQAACSRFSLHALHPSVTSGFQRSAVPYLARSLVRKHWAPARVARKRGDGIIRVVTRSWSARVVSVWRSAPKAFEAAAPERQRGVRAG